MLKDDIELDEYLLPSPSGKPLPALPDGDIIHDKVIHKGHIIHLNSLNWRESKLLRVQILLCFLLFALDGAADQTVGTLMPYLVKYYDTTQTHISIVFVLQFIGYTMSAIVNEYLHRLLGKRGVLMCAAFSMSFCFLINSIIANLNLYIAVHIFYGLGAGLSSSSINVYISGIIDHNEIMGLLHGFYGIGCVVSPPMVSWVLSHWGFRYYYGILGTIGLICMVAVWFIFEDETKWKYDYLTSLEDEEGTERRSVLSLIVDPIILNFCLYLFFYVGAEIAIGSWLLTYLREIKSMEQMEAAIVVSWFWVGLTVGRIALGFVTKLFKNEYVANLTYSLISFISFTIFTIFSWNYKGDNFVIWSKLLVFCSGVFIGPLYPTGSVVLMKLLPVSLHVAGVGVSSSLGGSGSAVIPFLVGVFGRWFGFKYLMILINITILAYSMLWMCIRYIAKYRTSFDF
uniref:MFS transporter n=1 Tax=Cyberlindnera americana TaxID=36016 RepID=A0A5P8N8K9_9ASCO|nr:MFS transporter [Cyberlindnera americana]